MSRLILGTFEDSKTGEKYNLTVRHDCKLCNGRGFQGIDRLTKERLGCPCLKRFHVIDVKIKKEEQSNGESVS